VTVDKIYTVLKFVNGGWMADVRTVSTSCTDSSTSQHIFSSIPQL